MAEGRFKGHFRDSNGLWHDEEGGAEIEHLGPMSRVSTNGRGSGEVTWQGTTGTGPYHYGDLNLRLHVVQVRAGVFDYEITDQYGDVISKGRIQQ